MTREVRLIREHRCLPSRILTGVKCRLVFLTSSSPFITKETRDECVRVPILKNRRIIESPLPAHPKEFQMDCPQQSSSDSTSIEHSFQVKYCFPFLQLSPRVRYSQDFYWESWIPVCFESQYVLYQVVTITSMESKPIVLFVSTCG